MAATRTPMPIPHRDNPEVMDTAARLLRNTRSMGSRYSTGLASLDQSRDVARNLALTYILMDNLGGTQNALLYARVEQVFDAWAYRLSMAESSVTYRLLTKKD